MKTEITSSLFGRLYELVDTKRKEEYFQLLQLITTYRAFPCLFDLIEAFPDLIFMDDYLVESWNSLSKQSEKQISDLYIFALHEFA